MATTPISTNGIALDGQLRQWRLAPATRRAVLGDPFADSAQPLPPLIAHLLARRGFASAHEAREFLDCADSLFEDPLTLPDVDRATARLRQARDRRETVAVYGDFDADGVTGTALLVKALRRFGLSVVSYIPHRVTEGHGLNTPAVEKLTAQGITLIVTVDCGVTDVAAINDAKAKGVDTIVTDHHLVAARLPDAAAIINPHAPHSRYAFDHLTGVGMVLKLAQAILEPEHGNRWADGLMELAAIGTITDLAPLLGENRYIVSRGLKHLARTESLGLRALMRAARIDTAHVTAESIGFGIGPRLNAAGRLDHADIALELLTTEDRSRAEALVRELDGFNTQRQQLTETTLTAARLQVPSLVPPLIAVGSPEFNPGVVGLVAGKLAEEFGAPTLCYTADGGRIMASCRSAPGFHWADALTACEDILVRYGGHAQAAGFACEERVLPVLIERLQAIAAEQLGGVAPVLDGMVEAEVQLAELMGPTFQVLRKMEPFGMGNPSPVFLTRGAQVRDCRPLGQSGNHFKLSLSSGGALWDAVCFRQQWLGNGTTHVDIVFTLEIDHYNGNPRLRLTVKDYAPSMQPRLSL